MVPNRKNKTKSAGRQTQKLNKRRREKPGYLSRSGSWTVGGAVGCEAGPPPARITESLPAKLGGSLGAPSGRPRSAKGAAQPRPRPAVCGLRPIANGRARAPPRQGPRQAGPGSRLRALEHLQSTGPVPQERRPLEAPPLEGPPSCRGNPPVAKLQALALPGNAAAIATAGRVQPDARGPEALVQGRQAESTAACGGQSPDTEVQPPRGSWGSPL